MKGELRLKVYNLDSDVLLRRPELRLVLPDGEVRSIRLRSVRRVPDALLVQLDGVGDRDAAERLRGARLEVPRELLGETEEGEYYACDLEGCSVWLGGAAIGTVTRVQSYPTCDALVVERPGGKPIEVPLSDAYVAAVDLAARRIELSSLDGLD